MSARRDVDSAWDWLTVGFGFTMYSLLVLYWCQEIEKGKQNKLGPKKLKTVNDEKFCAESYLLKCGLNQVRWEHVAARQEQIFAVLHSSIVSV